MRAQNAGPDRFAHIDRVDIGAEPAGLCDPVGHLDECHGPSGVDPGPGAADLIERLGELLADLGGGIAVHQALNGERGFDDAVQIRCGRIEVPRDGGHGPVVELIDDRGGDGLFGVEVVVERALADPCALQDIGESGFAVADLTEQLDSRFDDFATCCFSAGLQCHPCSTPIPGLADRSRSPGYLLEPSPSANR